MALPAGQAQLPPGSLCRLTGVDDFTIDGLNVLVAATGAKAAWHRRKALREYLERELANWDRGRALLEAEVSA